MGRTAALILAASLASGAYAHHGWSEYDASKPLMVSGTITASGYEHPHGHISLEAPGKTWQVVLAPPSRMERRGLAACPDFCASAAQPRTASTSSPTRVIPHKTPPERHFPEEAERGMREWRCDKVWAKPPKIEREKALDLVEIKGIYRARALAEG